jgi:hypothetical protein
MDKPKEGNPPKTLKSPPLQFIVDSSTTGRFSNFIHIQHEAENFSISFFEVQRPLIMGESEIERKKAIEVIETVPAVCVSRIIVTPSSFKGFLGAMQLNWEKYERKYIKKEPPKTE